MSYDDPETAANKVDGAAFYEAMRDYREAADGLDEAWASFDRTWRWLRWVFLGAGAFAVTGAVLRIWVALA